MTPSIPGMTTVLVRFASNKRQVNDEQEITTIYDLISGVGGNLGLFLGFSLVGALFQFYDDVWKTRASGIRRVWLDWKENLKPNID